jgi:hypothetical protein
LATMFLIRLDGFAMTSAICFPSHFVFAAFMKFYSSHDSESP